MRQAVFDYIKKKYKVFPEYPLKKYKGNAVFRHEENRKWFALVMKVQRNKLGLSGTEYVDVVNLKIDDMIFLDILMKDTGIIPVYHMNKQHWITVILDGTVKKERVFELIGMSFMTTALQIIKRRFGRRKNGLFRRILSFLILNMSLTKRMR